MSGRFNHRVFASVRKKVLHIKVELVTTLANWRDWLDYAERFNDFAIVDLDEKELSEEFWRRRR